MARPKAFDRDQALDRALDVFWDHGYVATSTDDLLRAMGIGRQSFYDTFGDKHSLFVEALLRYNARRTAAIGERLALTDSPLGALQSLLLAMAEQSPSQRARGCMGVNAIAELGQADPEVDAATRASTRYVETVLERTVLDAKVRGEVAGSIEPRAAARFLLSMLHGLRLSSKAGASPEALREIARFALRSLTSP